MAMKPRAMKKTMKRGGKTMAMKRGGKAKKK